MSTTRSRSWIHVFHRGGFTGAIALLLVPWAFAAHAEEPRGESRMANGAAVLSEGVSTFSLNLGFDFPEPAGYSVRIDHGISDRVQLGGSGSFIGKVGVGALHGRYLWHQSDDRTHALSVELNLAYGFLDESVWGDSYDQDDGASEHALFVQPMFGYELRPFESKRTGFYFKAGPNFGIGLDEQWTKTVGRAVLGVQHRFGETFSMALHGGVGLSDDEIVPLARLSFGWAF